MNLFLRTLHAIVVVFPPPLPFFSSNFRPRRTAEDCEEAAVEKSLYSSSSSSGGEKSPPSLKGGKEDSPNGDSRCNVPVIRNGQQESWGKEGDRGKVGEEDDLTFFFLFLFFFCKYVYWSLNKLI